ncbi:MAG: hypothetical protein CM15mV10_3030 [uncultured marine virus]|nr:MAG: hypothetical protein CM15mV10_3030 [uncultured marine virus]
MLTNLLNYKTLLLIKTIKMKTFRIEEKFTGYAEVTIEAETEEEALSLYNRGHYPDSDYVMDDMFMTLNFNKYQSI